LAAKYASHARAYRAPWPPLEKRTKSRATLPVVSWRMALAYTPLPPSSPALLPTPRAAAGLGATALLVLLLSGSSRQEKTRRKYKREHACICNGREGKTQNEKRLWPNHKRSQCVRVFAVHHGRKPVKQVNKNRPWIARSYPLSMFLSSMPLPA
jgi:hypothetical protein